MGAVDNIIWNLSSCNTTLWSPHGSWYAEKVIRSRVLCAAINMILILILEPLPTALLRLWPVLLWIDSVKNQVSNIYFSPSSTWAIETTILYATPHGINISTFFLNTASLLYEKLLKIFLEWRVNRQGLMPTYIWLGRKCFEGQQVVKFNY